MSSLSADLCKDIKHDLIQAQINKIIAKIVKINKLKVWQFYYLNSYQTVVLALLMGEIRQ